MGGFSEFTVGLLFLLDNEDVAIIILVGRFNYSWAIRGTKIAILGLSYAGSSCSFEISGTGGALILEGTMYLIIFNLFINRYIYILVTVLSLL
jgi:hypothetical protein